MINLSYKISIERGVRYRNPRIFAATFSRKSRFTLPSINKAIDFQIQHRHRLNSKKRISLLLWFPDLRKIYFPYSEEHKIWKFTAALYTRIPNRFDIERKYFGSNFKTGIESMRKNIVECTRTGVRLAVAVGPSGRCAVPGLHFQCVRSLLLPIEHHLREDLPGLPIDLEVILSFVSVAVHHVISDLKPNFPPLYTAVSNN